MLKDDSNNIHKYQISFETETVFEILVCACYIHISSFTFLGVTYLDKKYLSKNHP